MRTLFAVIIMAFCTMMLGVRHPASAQALPPIYDEAGQAQLISAWEGKPLLLHFWATWCGPCVADVPVLHKLQAKYGDDLRVVTVSLDAFVDGHAPTEALHRFYAKHALMTPMTEHWFDHEMALFGAMRVLGLPATILLDAHGAMVMQIHGPLRPRSGALQGQIFELIYGDSGEPVKRKLR